MKRREFMTLVGGGLRSRTLIPKEMKIEHFSTVKDLTDEKLESGSRCQNLICARNVVADTRHSHVEPAAVVEVS
jgi:hypothetical protein